MHFVSLKNYRTTKKLFFEKFRNFSSFIFQLAEYPSIFSIRHPTGYLAIRIRYRYPAGYLALDIKSPDCQA
jgi:hypothetical protein